MSVRNPLFAVVTDSSNAHELFLLHRKVRERLARAFQLYQAGEDKTSPGEKYDYLYHNFQHVINCFQQFFIDTQIDKVGDPKWAKKVVILDALTDTMVHHTWQPPESKNQPHWDCDAQKKFDRIMLSLGSRFLTVVASCLREHLPKVTSAILARMTTLRKQAIETEEFDRGFSILTDLIKGAHVDAKIAPEVKTRQ